MEAGSQPAPHSTTIFSASLKKADLCYNRLRKHLSSNYMTAGLTRMLAPKGAQLIPLLSEMYRNVGTRKASGLKELGEQPHPKGSRARAQSFSLTRAAQSQGCGSQSHRHHLLLNCTFTFTQTISKSWKKCRVRGGEGQVPLRSHDPQWASPGRTGREGASGCQSLGTSSPRARAQQASSSSHKYRHA